MEVLLTADRFVSTTATDLPCAKCSTGVQKPKEVVSFSLKQPCIVAVAGTPDAFLSFSDAVCSISPEVQTAEPIGIKSVELRDAESGELLWQTEYFDWGLPLAVRVPYSVLNGVKKVSVKAEGYSPDGTHYMFSGEVDVWLLKAYAGEDECTVYASSYECRKLNLGDAQKMSALVSAPKVQYLCDAGIELYGSAELAKGGELTGKLKLDELKAQNDWILHLSADVFRKVCKLPALYKEQNVWYAVLQDAGYEVEEKLLHAELGGDVEVGIKAESDNKLKYKASIYAYLKDEDGKTAQLSVKFSSLLGSAGYSADVQTGDWVETDLKALYGPLLKEGQKGLLGYADLKLTWGQKELAKAELKFEVPEKDAVQYLQKLGMLSVQYKDNQIAEVSTDYFPVVLILDVPQFKLSVLADVTTGDVEAELNPDKTPGILATRVPSSVLRVEVAVADRRVEVGKKELKGRQTATFLFVYDSVKAEDGSYIGRRCEAENGKIDAEVLVAYTGKGFAYSDLALLVHGKQKAIVVDAPIGKRELKLADGGSVLVCGSDCQDDFELYDLQTGKALISLPDGTEVRFRPPQVSIIAGINEQLELFGRVVGTVPPLASSVLLQSGKETKKVSVQLPEPFSLTTDRGTVKLYVNANVSVPLSLLGKQTELQYVIERYGFQLPTKVLVSSIASRLLEADGNTLLSRAGLNAEITGDSVRVRAWSPGELTVLLVADSGSSLKLRGLYAINREVSLCSIGRGKRFEKLTVILQSLGQMLKQELSVPGPKVSASQTGISVLSLGWACEVSGTAEYESLDGQKVADRFSTAERGFVPFSSFLSSVPAGRIAVRVEQTGQTLEADGSPMLYGSWPNPIPISPALGIRGKVACMQNGKLVPCWEAELNRTDVVAVFEWNGKEYVWKLGKPNAEVSEEKGVLKVRVEPMVLAPAVLLAVLKRAGRSPQITAVPVWSSAEAELKLDSITYEADVYLLDKYYRAHEIYKYLRYGFAYAFAEPAEGGYSVYAVAVTREHAVLKLVQKLGQIEVVLLKSEGSGVLELNAFVPIDKFEVVLETVAERKVLYKNE